MSPKEEKAIKTRIKSEVPWNKRLAQLAEECCEGGQAALKLIRAYDGESQLDTATCRVKLIEEMADILICMDMVLNDLDASALGEIYEMKLKRWEERLNGRSKS